MKMFNNILNDPSITVLEVELKGSSPAFRFLDLRIRKKKLSIKYSSDWIKDIDELFKTKSGNPTVILMLKGRGILYRALEGEVPLVQVLHMMLPNAETDAFYVETYQTAMHTHVGIVRVDVMNNLIAALSDKGWLIVDVRLKPLPLADLSIFGKEVIETGVWKSTYVDGMLTHIEKSEKAGLSHVRLGDETLPADQVAALGAGVGRLLHMPGREQTEFNLMLINQKEARQKRLFTLAGWAVLLLVFGGLLANFLLHDYYSGRLAELQTATNINVEQLDEIDHLKEEISKKQTLMRSAGLNNRVNMAYWADQIGATVYESIVLTELNQLPLKKMEKNGEKLEFTNTQIVAKGITGESTDLNEWIKVLNNMDWIDKVDIVGYVHDPQSNQASFELILWI